MAASFPATSASNAGPANQVRKPQGILHLDKYLRKPVNVKLHGGRELAGKLIGYDAVINLVLDETVEYLRDLADPYMRRLKPGVSVFSKPSDSDYMSRPLGRVVIRTTQVMRLCSADGMMSIENPFDQPEQQPEDTAETAELAAKDQS